MPPPLHALLPLLLLLSASTTAAVDATTNGERRPALSAHVFVPGNGWLTPDAFKPNPSRLDLQARVRRVQGTFY